MLSIHDHAGIGDFSRSHRVDPYQLKRLRNAFYKKQLPAELALQELPIEVESRFSSHLQFHTLHQEERHDSRLDGASKLIFRTESGHLIESVILRIASGRTSLCLSSQAGCAANCAFCATGKMGLGRNLTSSEILDQVIQVNLLLKGENRRLRNLVFMGMGEPLHNEQNLYGALEVLTSTECFGFDEQRLLISTVGIPEAMVRCARKFRRVGMALSLHSARQEVREQIVPLARRYPLEVLRQALREVSALQNQRVMIEYILLKGVNDTEADLSALATYLTGLSVHINLIPYNAIAGAPELEGTERPRREAFAQALKAQGFKVTLRYSLGADIAAACGTLACGAARKVPRAE